MLKQTTHKTKTKEREGGILLLKSSTRLSLELQLCCCIVPLLLCNRELASTERPENKGLPTVYCYCFKEMLNIHFSFLGLRDF